MLDKLELPETLDELELLEVLDELEPLGEFELLEILSKLDPPDSPGKPEPPDPLTESEPLGSTSNTTPRSSDEYEFCEPFPVEITLPGLISITSGVVLQPEHSITADNTPASSLNLLLITKRAPSASKNHIFNSTPATKV